MYACKTESCERDGVQKWREAHPESTHRKHTPTKHTQKAHTKPRIFSDSPLKIRSSIAKPVRDDCLIARQSWRNHATSKGGIKKCAHETRGTTETRQIHVVVSTDLSLQQVVHAAAASEPHTPWRPSIVGGSVCVREGLLAKEPFLLRNGSS